LKNHSVLETTKVDDVKQVQAVCDCVSEYRHFFDVAASSSGRGAGTNGRDDPTAAIAAALEDRFFATEVHLNKLAFLQQSPYAVFFSYSS
jgi:V-type H+-transporting ATPase subunit d